MKDPFLSDWFRFETWCSMSLMNPLPSGLISLKLFSVWRWGVLWNSVSSLLCRKPAHLVVIISMRLKIDQVMLRAVIELVGRTTWSGWDWWYNFNEIKTGLAMEMMIISRLWQVCWLQELVLGCRELISLKLFTVGDDSWSSIGEWGKFWNKGYLLVIISMRLKSDRDGGSSSSEHHIVKMTWRLRPVI
jgi:hypothetical protein